MNPCDRGFRIAFLFFVLVPVLFVGCLRASKDPYAPGTIWYCNPDGSAISVSAPENQKTPAKIQVKQTEKGIEVKASTGESDVVQERGWFDFLEGTGPMQIASVLMVVFSIVTFAYPKVFSRTFSGISFASSLGVSAYALFMDHPIFLGIAFVLIVGGGVALFIAYKKGKLKGVSSDDSAKPLR